jgi:hypothetical protein
VANFLLSAPLSHSIAIGCVHNVSCNTNKIMYTNQNLGFERENPGFMTPGLIGGIRNAKDESQPLLRGNSHSIDDCSASAF